MITIYLIGAICWNIRAVHAHLTGVIQDTPGSLLAAYLVVLLWPLPTFACILSKLLKWSNNGN